MTREIALVLGDGAAPEMMEQATQIALKASRLDGIELKFLNTPMGWNAFQAFGDSTPKASLEEISRIGIVFFGGVGDPALDKTLGAQHPQMMPEPRSLLALRKRLGLLLNFRPMILQKELAHLSPLRPEFIPDEGIEMSFIRFLLEDSYFGTTDLRDEIAQATREKLGIKLKQEVTGDEEIITELAYYRGPTIRTYFRAAYQYARMKNLPMIVVDKSNVMPRYVFWRRIAEQIAKEFPDVPTQYKIVDATCMLLFKPSLLRGVIACGNEHGDILSDGGAEAVGGLGMMHSSAINPVTKQAMFESGAGTAPTLAGQDVVNPIGRILTGAMMLRHIGAPIGADAIENAVHEVLKQGYRTRDIAEKDCSRVLKCSEMGTMIFEHIK